MAEKWGTKNGAVRIPTFVFFAPDFLPSFLTAACCRIRVIREIRGCRRLVFKRTTNHTDQHEWLFSIFEFINHVNSPPVLTA
jgi:hypothetical protein